jgi:putative zinc finger/helix-turn-helix YgiT family protein
MKCIKCGAAMESASRRNLVATVRGEELEVQVVAPQCSGCGRVVLTRSSRRMYDRAAADAYRRAHSLLTTSEMDDMRRNLGMTWKQFAEYIPIGIATLKRWLSGEIQSPSLDSLVRLRADLSFAQRATEELMTRLVAHSVKSETTAVTTTSRRVRARWAVEWAPQAANTSLATAA